MFRLLRFTIYFSLSYLILNIPIGHIKLFDFLGKHTDPYIERGWSQLNEIKDNQIKKGKNVGKKIFSNTLPKNQDEVKSQLSSNQGKKKEKIKKQIDKEHIDNYTVEERELLKKIITNHY